jgi:antitoxin ParD1/3/4
MANLNISLPDAMREFVEHQVDSGDFSTPSEYIRALIREAQKRRAEERLEALLLEGLDSGDAGPMTKKDWQRLRKQALVRLAQRGLKKRRR